MTQETAAPPTQKAPPEGTRQRLEAKWLSRAAHQGLKAKSAEYRKREVEFFVGAMAMLDDLGYQPPAIWMINIMSGRPVTG